MLEQINNSLDFYAFYSQSGILSTGVPVIIDIWKGNSLILVSGVATEIGDGLYLYTLPSGSVNQENEYIGIFKTTLTSVDKQHQPDMWVVGRAGVENLDATISSRAKPSDVAITVSLTGTVINASVAISSTVAQAANNGMLGLVTNTTFNQSILSNYTGTLPSVTKMWLAIKTDDGDVDGKSIIFLEKTAGLTIVSGLPYTTTTDGSIVISGSQGAWVVTLKVEEAATALIGYFGTFPAELKMLLGGDTFILWSGNCIISNGVIKAYS